jgi:hypothetical protein
MTTLSRTRAPSILDDDDEDKTGAVLADKFLQKVIPANLMAKDTLYDHFTTN